MKGMAGTSFGLARTALLRSRGRALPRASRTIRRWIPSFLATPWIVPVPCSYSRRICSNSSTLALLSKPYPLPGRQPQKTVHASWLGGWAKSKYRSGPNQVDELMAGRRPASARNGRPGIAPDRLLRCCVLKHLKGWSFRDLDRELRSNLIYRRFTRFDAEATPTYSAFSRLFAVLSPEATQQIHHRVVGLAREKGAAPGHKIRIDSTVVESNVHYPSDSTLLGDGIRVLSRALKRMAAKCQAGALEVVNHGRAVKHRLLEISRAAKSLTQTSRERMQESYRKLLGLTRGVVREAGQALRRWGSGGLGVGSNWVDMEAQARQLRRSGGW